MKELLFKVVTGERGNPKTLHEYKIFTDGSVEGFGGNVIGATNYHFTILNRKLAELQHKLINL